MKPLPDGWIETLHISGMPVYMNVTSRVCTLSRPYQLDKFCARFHRIPMSSIPCFMPQKNDNKNARNKDNEESEVNFGMGKEKGKVMVMDHYASDVSDQGHIPSLGKTPDSGSS